MEVGNSGVTENHAAVLFWHISKMAYTGLGQNALFEKYRYLYIGELLSNFQEET
jgi:hypothetical protein